MAKKKNVLQKVHDELVNTFKTRTLAATIVSIALLLVYVQFLNYLLALWWIGGVAVGVFVAYAVFLSIKFMADKYLK